MEKSYVLLLGILCSQLVVHCCAAVLKVEEGGANTVLDPKASHSLSISDNQTGQVSSGADIGKVKNDNDRVGGLKEGGENGIEKTNPSREVDSKASQKARKIGGGSSDGSKIEGGDHKQKPSDDGVESKEVPEVGKGGNVESTRKEECDPSNRCNDEENKLVACLRVPGNDSPHLSLLIQNEGKDPLWVTIVAPDSETKVKVEGKGNSKVKISIGNWGTGSSIVLKAGNGHCELDLKDLITQSSHKEPENSSNSAYTNFLTRIPTIAIVFFALVLILASAWMCISFRHRRLSSNVLKYQKLDEDLPVSNEEKPELQVNDGWDNTWDDNWDDEEAPHTPSMPITPSLSGKGLASRRLNKEGWKD